MKILFKKIILTGLAVFLLTSGLSCKLFPGEKPPASLTQPTTLTYWGVWDDTDDLEILISDFEALHPKIKIEYKKFRFSEYEQRLLEAWADDQGPDIYSIPASWLKEYQHRITPQPENIQLAFEEVKKTLGKTEIETVVRSVPVYSPQKVKSLFVDIVAEDILIDNKIYGLPYSLDTLALIYNQDLLDKAGIATPPTNWTELKEAVKALTILDNNNNLLQSGVALGTADNIDEAIDVASLLMMQNGATMIDQRGQIAFQREAGEKGYYPGLEALRFFTDFADPIKEVYTWNNTQPNATQAFISGTLAMTLGYSYNLEMLRASAPKLDIKVAPMLQIQGSMNPVNYTDYWVETVSHKSARPDLAWGFLNFATAENEVKKYLDKTKRPTALRSLISVQRENPDIFIFANQTLTADRWYRGNDALKMEEYFKEMVKGFSSALEPLELMNYTASRINQTL